jgi:DNA-damage-inducible protein D
MKKENIWALHQAFEQSVRVEQGIEFWEARELMGLLEYARWENFVKVLDKAAESCRNAGEQVEDHFLEVTKMVTLGSGAERSVTDVLLTRYACYLVAQNGDPRKEVIAFAQSYFALQTRKQELVEQRIALNERLEARRKLTASETELSKNIFERGVDQEGFGRIRSKGDTALFGGFTTSQMKTRLGIPQNRPLADFLPTVTIAAKYLANEITNFNVKNRDLYGEHLITEEHVTNNKEVREILIKRGVKPEELPAEEDIKKLARKVQSLEKKIPGESKGGQKKK